MSFADNLRFLKEDYIILLTNGNPSIKPAWGKMNFQQMVEHMSYSVKIANGTLKFLLQTPPEKLDQMKSFAIGEKPFRENTPNPLIGEDTVPVVFDDVPSAIKDLKDQLNAFYILFETKMDLRVENPFFGELNYEEWVALLSKHARHHLKQFGLKEH